MNKECALQRLDALENEASELRKIINSVEYTVDDIKSVSDAIKILGGNYNGDIELSSAEEIKLIIKAANFLDNKGSIWKPDFHDNSYKYLPYFTNNSSGWSLDFVYYWGSCAYCPVGFYFKNKSTAEVITKRFIKLYSEWLSEE